MNPKIIVDTFNDATKNEPEYSDQTETSKMIPKELRKREFHQKGSVIRKRQNAAAKKRLIKKLIHL